MKVWTPEADLLSPISDSLFTRATNGLFESMNGRGIDNFVGATAEAFSKAARLIVSEDLREVNEIAAQFAVKNAGNLIVGIDQAARGAVGRIVARGIDEGWDDDEVAKAISKRVGLDDRFAGAVENYRRGLIDKRGFSRSAARKKAGEYADRLRYVRASRIARTEIQRALNEGQEEVWKALYEEGVLDDGYRLRFATHKDERRCERCKPLHGTEYSIMEKSLKAPLHPNCRCFFVLVDKRGRIVKSAPNYADAVRTHFSKVREPRDGDGDGLVYDGTKRERPVRPDTKFPQPVKRGINLNLTADEWKKVQRWSQPPMDESEIGQDKKIGQMIEEKLRAFKGHQNDERFAGIGRSWTTDAGMAQTAAVVNTGGPDSLPVIVTANVREADIDSDDLYDSAVGSDGRGGGSESEVRLRPDSEIEVLDIEVRLGQRFESVYEKPQDPDATVSSDYPVIRYEIDWDPDTYKGSEIMEWIGVDYEKSSGVWEYDRFFDARKELEEDEEEWTIIELTDTNTGKRYTFAIVPTEGQWTQWRKEDTKNKVMPRAADTWYEERKSDFVNLLGIDPSNVEIRETDQVLDSSYDEILGGFSDIFNAYPTLKGIINGVGVGEQVGARTAGSSSTSDAYVAWEFGSRTGYAGTAGAYMWFHPHMTQITGSVSLSERYWMNPEGPTPKDIDSGTYLVSELSSDPYGRTTTKHELGHVLHHAWLNWNRKNNYEIRKLFPYSSEYVERDRYGRMNRTPFEATYESGFEPFTPEEMDTIRQGMARMSQYSQTNETELFAELTAAYYTPDLYEKMPDDVKELAGPLFEQLEKDAEEYAKKKGIKKMADQPPWPDLPFIEDGLIEGETVYQDKDGSIITVDNFEGVNDGEAEGE